jgi:DNA polymerase (family 10)
VGQGKAGLTVVRALVKEGVRSVAALRRPEILARLPKASRAEVLYRPTKRVPLRTAEEVTEDLRKRLIFCADDSCLQLPIYTVGSVRRQVPIVKDLDLLAVLPAEYKGRLETVLEGAKLRGSGLVEIVDTYANGSRRHSCIVRRVGTKKSYMVDIFLTTENELPYALFHYTGDSTYNIRTRALAKKKGYTLNQYGLFDADGKRVKGTSAIKDEQGLAEFLGVSYRTPVERNSPKKIYKK